MINISKFGVIGDGKTVWTEQINRAITELSSLGGGELVFDSGIYLSGSIILKSNVTLVLPSGCTLKATGRKEDYIADELTHGSIFEGEECMGGTFIWGENLKNIGIKGQGTIDGNGIFVTVGERALDCDIDLIIQEERAWLKWRPLTLKLYGCTNVLIEGVRFVNPASWNVGMSLCSDVCVRGVNIKSDKLPNGDGLDFNACERVFVSDCSFDCTDDCIAMQSAFPDKACKNITIKNCYFKSLQAAIRAGMACLGDFENILVSNCVFEDCNCGFKIQQTEIGAMQRFIFRGITMKNVFSPLFFTHNLYECTKKSLRKEDQAFGKFGKMRDFIISDCIIDNTRLNDALGLIFDADEGCVIEDFFVTNLIYRGRADKKASSLKNPPYLKMNRPEPVFYKSHKVWDAMFIRGTKNLVFTNLKIYLEGEIVNSATVVYGSENIKM